MVEALAGAATAASNAQTAQQLQVSAVKKSLEVEEQTAASLLSQLDAGSASAGETGGNIDVTA